jgi:ubiquitin-like modifier-activating enzyme ATG7
LRLHPPPALVALARAADGDDAVPPSSLVAVGFQLDDFGRAAPRLLRIDGGEGSPASVAAQAEEAAEAASRLNLDLMRWRALPELEPARASVLRVLLLGAGTLGCNLSRALLAWGVRAITLVDGGRVSLSSPARQPLYEHADAAGGGRWKAEAAADALRRTCPSAKTAGVVLEIPSPGRPAPPPGSAAAAAQAAAVAQIDSLVSSHDVVFLLTDTRESRWLPTVIAAARGTPSFTLALGVDSLLMLRSHSCTEGSGGAASGDLPAPRLSCYFCADPTATFDGSSGRAMDEACTISRPGLAPIASALAAELVVALLHHEHRFSALDAAGGAWGSPLGIAPQQLRLDLQSLTVREGAARAFPQCSACSEAVLSEFRRDRGFFLHRALCPSGPAFLEELSGLAALKAARDALAGGSGGEVADEGWAAC